MQLFGKNVHSPTARFLVWLLALLLLTLNCSKKSTDPDKPPDNGAVGVLLSGDANANAVGQTEEFIATIPSIVLNDETGLVANKVFAVISPSATVGQVNSLLDSMQARIICMDDASVFLTLSTPTVSTTAGIDSITSRLAQSEPFLFALPCFIPIPPTPAEPEPEPLLKEIPGNPAAGNIAHLKACYMPAAWNAMSHANSVNHRVTVLVPDAYAQLTPHAELPAQEFVTIPGDGADVRFNAAINTALGNHGFYVSGILGAEYNDIGATGIHPGTSNLLRIRSLNVGSDEWGVKLQQISNAIPSTNYTLVSTSFGYNDPAFSDVPKWQRILLALKWRELVGEKQTQFLHLTSSGNEGRVSGEGALSVFNSPFTMAAQMSSPWDWLGAGEYTEADSLGYVQLQQLYGTTKPYILQPLTNVLVVGSSRLNGARSAFSNVGADVRFVGERVFCPCITNDATCIDGFGTPSGTSMTAPQAAGLAAYLMNLKPNLTPMQAKQIILSSYDNSVGIVNAYRAVLSLDDGLSNAPVRKSILNVADMAAGTFDEKDLEAFLRVYGEPQYTRDYSPYDLNGDGWTGGATTAPFDLDINTPPAYATVDVIPCDQPSTGDTTLDESALTDRAILLYYAYTPLYSGSERVRDSLFKKGCSPFTIVETSHLLKYDLRANLQSIIWDIDSSQGTFLQKALAVRELACNGLATYVFDVDATCNTALSGGANLTSLDITGASNSAVTGTASLENNLGAYCDYFATSKAYCYSVIRFTASEQLGFIPFRFVVNGSIDIGDGNTAQTNASILFHTVDANGKPDGATYAGFNSQEQSLPYVFDGVLNPLTAGHMYELFIMTNAADAVFTLSDPGPDSKFANVSVSLHVGP